MLEHAEPFFSRKLYYFEYIYSIYIYSLQSVPVQCSKTQGFKGGTLMGVIHSIPTVAAVEPPKSNLRFIVSECFMNMFFWQLTITHRLIKINTNNTSTKHLIYDAGIPLRTLFWWFQPIEKAYLSNWIISQGRGNIKETAF